MPSSTHKYHIMDLTKKPEQATHEFEFRMQMTDYTQPCNAILNLAG